LCLQVKNKLKLERAARQTYESSAAKITSAKNVLKKVSPLHRLKNDEAANENYPNGIGSATPIPAELTSMESNL